MTWRRPLSWLRREERRREANERFWWDAIAQEYLDEALGETVAQMTPDERQHIIDSLQGPEADCVIRGELRRRVLDYLKEASVQ